MHVATILWCCFMFVSMFDSGASENEFSYTDVLSRYAELRKDLVRERYSFVGQQWKFHSESLETMLQRGNTSATNVSSICLNQTKYMMNNILKEPFAQQMFDAMGKIPSGALLGVTHWVGEFDECVGVKSPGLGDLSFTGRYCTVNASVAFSPKLKVNLFVGVCFPSGCGGDDILYYLKENPALVTQLIHLPAEIEGVDCHVPKSLDTAAMVSIVVCGIFIGLVVLGTAYDITIETMAGRLSGNSEAEGKPANGEARGGSAGPTSASGSAPHLLKVDEYTPLLNEGQAGGSAPSSQHSVSFMEKEPGWIAKFLLCFSAYTNTKKIMSTDQPKGALTCIHGIRVFSILWVVLGHTYAFNIAGIKNLTWILQLLQRVSFGAIINATVSVDTFFVMSGLLVTYLTLRQLEKKGGKLGVKGWILIYVHRYLRLTPVYMLLLMVWSCLMWYWGDGPLWPTTGTLDPNCAENWWTNLLYINNLYHVDKQCAVWSWYLSNDMQFYLFAPPFAYLLYRWPRVGVSVVSFFLFGSMAAAMAVTGVSHLPINVGALTAASGDFYMKYYIKPWCRFHSYCVGVLAGFVLHKTGLQKPLPKSLSIIAWAIAIGTGLATLYTIKDGQTYMTIPPLANAVAYNGIARFAWSCAVAWVIFACSTGNGHVVNRFLSWKAWIPLGRLTYCVYLVHPMIIMYEASSFRQLQYLTDVNTAFHYSSYVLLSFAGGLAASLLFEVPLMNVERMLI